MDACAVSNSKREVLVSDRTSKTFVGGACLYQCLTNRVNYCHSCHVCDCQVRDRRSFEDVLGTDQVPFYLLGASEWLVRKSLETDERMNDGMRK